MRNPLTLFLCYDTNEQMGTNEPHEHPLLLAAKQKQMKKMKEKRNKQTSKAKQTKQAKQQHEDEQNGKRGSIHRAPPLVRTHATL